MTPEINRPLPRNWWLQKPAYFKFMIREMTSVAVLAYTLLVIWALWAAADTQSFSAFYDFLRGPVSIGLHVVVFGLAFYHTITWIALTPKVMVEWRLTDRDTHRRLRICRHRRVRPTKPYARQGVLVHLSNA